MLVSSDFCTFSYHVVLCAQLSGNFVKLGFQNLCPLFLFLCFELNVVHLCFRPLLKHYGVGF